MHLDLIQSPFYFGNSVRHATADRTRPQNTPPPPPQRPLAKFHHSGGQQPREFAEVIQGRSPPHSLQGSPYANPPGQSYGASAHSLGRNNGDISSGIAARFRFGRLRAQSSGRNSGKISSGIAACQSPRGGGVSEVSIQYAHFHNLKERRYSEVHHGLEGFFR